MVYRRSLPAALLATGLCMPGCLFPSSSSGSGSDSTGDRDPAGGQTSGASADPDVDPQGTSSGGQVDETGTPGGDGDCYLDTAAGCTSVSWNDIATALDILYAVQSSYAGYTKSEALDIARELYDHGVVQRSYLQVVSSYATEGGYRLHVVVTDPEGQPIPSLSPADFEVLVDGMPLESEPAVSRLGDVDPKTSDLELTVSLVVDDSGSVRDCDANFVAQGLAVLLESLPPLYQASLVKFTSEVDVAQPLTDDPDALAEAALEYCTDRGGTALWDGLNVGHDTLPHGGGFEAAIVFTDGLDNSSSDDLAGVIEQYAATDTPVFVLGLGLPDILSLTNLATGTDGGFVYINSGERIIEGFETLSTFIRNSYVIDLEASAGSVEISVELENGRVSGSI